MVSDSTVYQAYYTNSPDITERMAALLAAAPGMKVLEPCAGNGVLVDAALNRTPGLQIDAFELDPKATAFLQHKYRTLPNVRVIQADTVTNDTLAIPPPLWMASDSEALYHRVIANPPYGGWQDYGRRDYLKRFYPDLYVKETYSLFLYKALQLLREDGILVFIIPDTWMHLHRQSSLRRHLLQHSKFLAIDLFPSSFFPGVNFGYASLCIVALQRVFDENACLDNNFIVTSGFDSPHDLVVRPQSVTVHHLNQRAVLSGPDSAILLSRNRQVDEILTRCRERISDVATCVTGFYSGNDLRYLRSGAPDVPRSSRYAVVDTELVCQDYRERSDILQGVSGPRYFVPIVKGGGVKYLKRDLWYMEWSREAVTVYRTHPKARFQNSQFYFRQGIGVPMVSASRITASLLDERLFDQSIVGIFPHNEALLLYMLAFFNSPTCNTLIRTINPSANNPANYIKKIPFIVPSDDELECVNVIVTRMLRDLSTNGRYSSSDETDVNGIVQKLYGF